MNGVIDTTGAQQYKNPRRVPMTWTKERECEKYITLRYAPRDPLMYISNEAKRTDGATTTYTTY